jgi:hypothetical protein
VVDLTSPTPAAIPADIPQALVAHVSAELMHAEDSGYPLEFKDVKRTLQDGMYNNFLKPHGWKYKRSNASSTRSGFDFYFHEGVYFSSDDPVPGDYVTKTITQHLLDELRVILPQIPPEPTVATKRVVDYRKAAHGAPIPKRANEFVEYNPPAKVARRTRPSAAAVYVYPGKATFTPLDPDSMCPGYVPSRLVNDLAEVLFAVDLADSEVREYQNMMGDRNIFKIKWPVCIRALRALFAAMWRG